jgi:molecular chaperone GrpE
MTDKNENEKHAKKLKVVDKRRAGRDVNAPSEEPSLKPSFVRDLESKVARMEIALQEKVEEIEKEAERSRERVKKDLEMRYEDKNEAVLLDVLEILENVERAAELSSSDPKIREGFKLLSQSCERFLEKNGLTKISPVDEDFDPNFMEALQVAKGPKGRVIKVYQNGYMKGGKLLKAAKVIVGGGEEGE